MAQENKVRRALSICMLLFFPLLAVFSGTGYFHPKVGMLRSRPLPRMTQQVDRAIGAARPRSQREVNVQAAVKIDQLLPLCVEWRVNTQLAPQHTVQG